MLKRILVNEEILGLSEINLSEGIPHGY